MKNFVDQCCLCNAVSGKGIYGDIDKPIMQSDNYIAIASIGAFIEGWAMVVPKCHKLSLATDFRSDEFISFLNKVKNHVENVYGNTVMFEHGSSNSDSILGCGVNHAHFHIVPHKTSIKSLLDPQLNWIFTKDTREDAPENQSDYLFYSDKVTTSVLEGQYCYPEIKTSQYFRKILGKSVGIGEKYDYKNYKHLESSRRTFSNLALK